MEELLSPNSLLALLTLSILEIVLGIDNVVFLAILTGKLPQHQQAKARTIGLALAALGRIALLLAISWVITLDQTELFTLPFDMPGHPVGEEEGAHGGTTPITLKDLILFLGGAFLIGKATWEIGHQMEYHGEKKTKTYSSFGTVLMQILAIDLVFSLDSVLTAVGMVRPEDYSEQWVPLTIMVSAILLAIAVMLAFSGPVARFVNNHPSVKMLALAFLILIGVVLVAEAFHSHVPRGYIYSSMGFSLFVEMLNLRAARARRAAA